jgi:hypothetical protein
MLPEPHKKEKDMWTNIGEYHVKIGSVLPQAKECLVSPEDGRGKKDTFLGLLWLCQHLDFEFLVSRILQQ